MRRAVVVLVALALLGVPGLQGQVRLQDLVFTGGFSVEGYAGNLYAVTVPIVDSTEHARATVGEFGARGSVLLLARSGNTVVVRFDSGLRQFVATGFELRDYAPREWVGLAEVAWSREWESGDRLVLTAMGRGRTVADRPPMPLFLQPGYVTGRGTMTFRSRPLPSGLRLDLTVDLRGTNYQSLELVSQLDLLDRDSRGLEAGADWGPEQGTWRTRFYGGYRDTDYPRQSSFVPDDPYRRDRTLHLGASWRIESSVVAELGIEGVRNRSNSQRPEYDALSVRGEMGAALPWWDLGVNASAVLTRKSYLHETPYARLVPGEEADNASVVYMDLQRALAENLDGALRFGWTRAETDIGASYYSRVGMSLLLNYRPSL